jgi:hypothetical protein
VEKEDTIRKTVNNARDLDLEAEVTVEADQDPGVEVTPDLIQEEDITRRKKKVDPAVEVEARAIVEVEAKIGLEVIADQKPMEMEIKNLKKLRKMIISIKHKMIN